MKINSMLLCFLFSCQCYAQENKTEAQKINRKYYVVNFKPGLNYQKDKPMSQQDLEPHRKYYQKLFEEGKVLIGGGFYETVEGMSILSVVNKEEAETICKNDPSVTMGIFIFEIKTIYAVFRGTNNQPLDLNNMPPIKKPTN